MFEYKNGNGQHQKLFNYAADRKIGDEFLCLVVEFHNRLLNKELNIVNLISNKDLMYRDLKKYLKKYSWRKIGKLNKIIKRKVRYGVFCESLSELLDDMINLAATIYESQKNLAIWNI